MNKSLENNFGNDDDYKALFAKKVYLYVLNQIKKEQIWPKEAEKDIAHDITMEAITKLLEKEKAGAVITNRYSYLMEIVKNELQQKKFIFHKNVRKFSVNTPIIKYESCGELQMSKRNEIKIAYASAANLDFLTVHVQGSGLVDVLTSEEKSIAELLNAGYSGKEIASKLGKSESTISRALAMIRFKLGKYKP